MNALRTALTIIALLIPAHVMAAGSSVGHGMGGQLPEFVAIIDQYNASGEEFRITGHCQSSCTTFLAIRKVCVEPSAELLFHAYRTRHEVDPVMTEQMASYYNGRLRSYLKAHGWLNTFDFHTLSGSQVIAFGYRACR
jgi:hypothetical protein